MKSQPRCRISVCFRLGQFFFDCLVFFKNILRAFYIPNAEEFRQKTFGKCVSHIRFIYRILQALTSFMFHYRMPCKAHEASIFCYRSIKIFHFSRLYLHDTCSQLHHPGDPTSFQDGFPRIPSGPSFSERRNPP